ncbi:T9SS type A sorting domain-containing protein, partial [bacterium]|nr:T9SS type A sorting domain-containing protein [bacterium]
IGNSGEAGLIVLMDEVRVIDVSVSGVEERRSASSLMPGSLSVGSYPNPFNSRTFIRYDLPAGAEVSLVLFNMKGQAVRTLVAEKQGAGIQQVSWDGLDLKGAPVPSGVYLYRLRARTGQGMQIASGKVILLE